MTLHRSVLSTLFIVLVGPGCATNAAPHRGTLDVLHAALLEVRAGDDGVLATLPSPDELVGARRQELIAALGSPRVCRTPVEEPCSAPGEILWEFYRAHHETIGPVLVVELDAAQIVVAARWRRGTEEASEPMAPSPPTSGDESELAVE